MHTMHLPPDLSLASSYIPACLCLLKCTVAFVLFVFSPVRGWICLFSMLLTDRILWNQAANTTILDVNAVCVGLVGGLMVMHARSDGIKTLVHFAITGVWILMSSLQILGATRLHRAYEVLFAAFSVSVLSCLYQAQERTELLALRSFVFVVANSTLPYMGVMLLHPDIDTYVNICRTLLVLLGEPEIASAWAVGYILCIGYQVRSTVPQSQSAVSAHGNQSRRSQTPTKYNSSYQSPYYYPNSTDFCDEAPPHGSIENGDQCAAHVQPQLALASASQGNFIPASSGVANSSNGSGQSEEAALLREALASRKGF